MSSPLRIALPTSSFLPSLGGAEIGLHNIASRLAAAGHRPVVIAPAPHVARLRRRGWTLPYEVVAFPPKIWGVLRHWPALGLRLFDAFFARLQRRYRFDFWHVTMGYPTGVAFAWHAARHPGTRYLIRCAGEDIQRHAGIGYGVRQHPSVDRLIRQWLPKAPLLVAITESVADEYRALGIPSEHIVHVPNGVDLARFAAKGLRREGRAVLGLDDEVFVWLAVGRNHPKKNFIGLLDAAVRLVRGGFPEFRLVIAGGGAGALMPSVVARGLETQILLRDEIGPAGNSSVPDLPAAELLALYGAADAFVFPSLMETFGIVLVEAMAAGLPVVTTDAPGCRDVIRNGKDALMVPIDDAAALAAAMQRVQQEASLRENLSARASRRAQDFSWDGVVARYLELYRGAPE